MSYNVRTNSYQYTDRELILNDYIPKAIGDDLNVYSAAVLSHPRWEHSSTFLGVPQDESGFTVPFRQPQPPHDHFISREEFSSEDRQFNGYPTIKNESPSPERIEAVAGDPYSTTSLSLQSQSQVTNVPSQRSKIPLDKGEDPKSGIRNVGGDSKNDDLLRKQGNGISSIIDRKKHEKSKPVRERNRIAANKCRIRKKKDIARLECDEKAIEQHYRELSHCVDNLNQEILYLKMQLLQHTNCSCASIHLYIEREAQQYIHTLGSR